MTIDDRTPGRGYLLPNIDNKLSADVSRIRQSILAVDDDITGALLALAAKAPLNHGHVISDISGLAEALAGKLDVTNLSLSLSDLADVSATAPAGGQVLMRVSAAWVPVSLQINHVQGLEVALNAVSSSAGSRWNAESVAAATAITSPADSSVFAAVVGGVLRGLTFANLKATLKAAFDTAYAAVGHQHDDRYNTKTEVTAALAGKSANGHNHDDRYNTKAEVGSLIANGNVAAVGGWSQGTISGQIESRAQAWANTRTAMVVDSNFALGVAILLHYAPSGGLGNGGDTAGSNLRQVATRSGNGLFAKSPSVPGVWRNVSGITLANDGSNENIGYFARVG